MLRYVLLTVYLLCFTCTLTAQDQPPVYSQHPYTTENGLPSNLIRGIQFDDATGFLWVITEGGLVRLNGVDFKSYSKEKISPIAPEKQVYAVKNNAGTIFISDGSGNLFQVQKNKPVLAQPSTLSSSFINYYFIAVSNSFFSAKVKAAPAFNTPFDKLLCISDTSCLVLYMNTLYRYSLSDVKPVELQHNISGIFKINNDCFIVDNNNHAFHFNTSTFSTDPVAVNASEKDLLNITNGSSQLFWNNGLSKPILIKEGKAWTLDYADHTLSANLITGDLPNDANISSVSYSEKNKLLFIGTESKGIIILSRNEVTPRKRKNANPKNKNAYFSQIALDNGNILTNEGDIIGDNTNPTTIPVNGKFSNRTSLTNNNLIWYNAVNPKLGIYCLHQYNKTTNETKVFDKITLLTQVEISNNTTYMANNKGIGVLSGDSIHYLYRYAAGAANINTYDFKEISPGILAIAGCSGLLRFNTSSNKLDTIYSQGDACFGSIWKYKDYIFWGSYGYGYFIYKNGIIKEMPLDKNEYLLYSHCFVADNFGYCWISTNRGLFKVQLDEIIAHYENEKIPVYYHYFGRKDGIEMTELNGGCTPCALLLKDQTISFPSMDGLLWVNPVTANPVLPFGDIFIDDVVIDNTSTNPDSLAITPVAPTVREMDVKLGFSAWCNKENIYLDYQINDTTAWIPVNTDNEAQIRLTNLAPGQYKLRIRKLNGFGVNNYAYKELLFTVSTPWHKQWWFYLLCLLALLGIVALFFNLRTRQYKIRQAKLEKQVAEKTKALQDQNEILEKNNTIKTRLISIISHDVITPLKFVTVAGKKLVEKRNVMSDELQDETIREITNTSQELQLLSTNILNWIKYQNENRLLAKENFNLSETIRSVLGVLNSLAKEKQLALNNTVDPQLNIYQFQEPLKILIYNLLTNAINFSEKGTVTISAQVTEDMLTLTVQDEGVGMTADQIKNIMADQFIISSANIDKRKGNGLGYLIIKDLVKTMQASLHIQSEKGKGTSVAIQFGIVKY